jgi:sodium transport system ATP-binding protein
VSTTPAVNGASIRVQGLTKRYRAPNGDPFLAVNEVSFEARSHNIYGLLGPNGAGKTTALRMLSTLVPPTSGTALVGGWSILDHPEKVRGQIGFLTGTTGLYPRLTAREVVLYFARMYGMEQDAAQARIDELFRELGVRGYEHKRCGELSSGMSQKVSIARAIVHDPPILILDEPTTGLDVLASQHIVEFIQRSREAGRCILFSTHIMSEAERLCDDIAIIHHGRIVASGTVDELRQQTGENKVEDVFLAILEEAEFRARGEVR